MQIRSQIDVERLLVQRHLERLEELGERWEDEGSEAALAGNPRRAFYLHHMAKRIPAMDAAADEHRAEAARLLRPA